MANRHQNRAFKARFRKAKVESRPRKVLEGGKMEKLQGPGGGTTCDVPGCRDEWQFSTHASVNGKREVVALRCGAHRLATDNEIKARTASG